MAEQFKAFFVANFPIDRITDSGEEGWYYDRNHLRNQYRFLDAIIEHISNTFCEPVQITMRCDGSVVAGPSGVTRLYALSTLCGWETIPAIVSTTTKPRWLDTSVPVTSVKALRSHYRLEPADIGFASDGRVYHRNYNPNPAQIMTTLEVAPATKQRIVTMLQKEAER